MANSLVSARITVNVANRLELLAKSMHRSKSSLAARAIEDFVDLQEWHAAAINEGIDAVERGDIVTHEEALEVLKSWGKRA